MKYALAMLLPPVVIGGASAIMLSHYLSLLAIAL
jgi:hypothetical protein